MNSIQSDCRAVLKFVSTCLILVAIPMAAAADEVDVYLLGGQSNMQGIAKLANAPKRILRQIPNVYFFGDKTFEPLQIGKTKTSKRAGEFGPEIGFAVELSSSERPVYLIKYAASGMPLHHGWNGNKWVGGLPESSRRNFYPGKSPDDETRGTLYRRMLERFRAGISKLETNGHQPVVRGFLWMQGEQDSKNEISATVYATSLKQLFSRVQEDIKVSADFAVAFGQVLPFEPALDRFTHRIQIRAQMSTADFDSRSPNRIKNAKMISTDGFGMLPDTVHYNAAGQLRLGEEFGKAVKQLQAFRKP